ncbi:hypothetical protein [uncultured Dubosiella sp.]|uniref:hypothetical protein n=1 Tax=uncultured Dubosiella sp. TaxID=1937011 RepID=UPI002731E4E0|nr:hypothetical protein [uncultured Dubosiella sp.]
MKKRTDKILELLTEKEKIEVSALAGAAKTWTSWNKKASWSGSAGSPASFPGTTSRGASRTTTRKKNKSPEKPRRWSAITKRS